ncbi:MAG: hypothetical protein KDE51_20175 [Anaerolineales bacterium]|nr:hypothetical protein [Anaerolineales bacterium]
MRVRIYLLLLAAFWLVACQEDPAPTAVSESAVVEPTEAADVVIQTATPTVLAEAATATPTTPAPTAVPTEVPTATPEPPKELTVCMAIRPQDIYLYGDQSLAARAVRHAVYENLYTNLGFSYQAQGIEAVPSPDNGGFRIETVEVNRGDRAVDATGAVISVVRGSTLINANGEAEVMDENPIVMNQMVVEFTLKPMVWSDGTPVTAADSVFSYEVAADRFTLSDKTLINQTASYEALDTLTVRWTGLPGHRDTLYPTNIWTPLPSHQLGLYNPIDLPNVAEATQMPLSSGPFVVASWGQEEIVLEANPYYYRTAEGLPYLDSVRLIFPVDLPENPYELVTSGQCDVVAQDLLPVEAVGMAEPSADVQTFVSAGPIMEHIAFGINSFSFPATDRPDWFQDPQARRAITLCTDRQAIVAQSTYGFANVMDSYIPAEHPLFISGAESLAYSPSTGNAILDELGYLDTNEDGIREDIETTRPFSITIATTGSQVRMTAANILSENLAECGIASSVDVQPGPTFFDDTRDGTIFGRKFDLAIFGWVIGTVPTCEHYLSSEVTGLPELGFVGFRGANVTGFFNEEFDVACEGALDAFYNTPEYANNHQDALIIFDNQRPSIPLFTRPMLTLATANIRNIQLDPTEPSGLWNIYEWDIER